MNEKKSSLYREIKNEGTHLAPSKKTKGRYRGALLDNDTNQVTGQAEFEPVEDDDNYDLNPNYPIENNNDYRYRELSEEDQEKAKYYGSVIAEILIQLGYKASPYITQIWNDNVAPAINKAKNKAWKYITRKNKGNKNDTRYSTTGISIQTATTLDFLSRDINVVIDDYSNNMTSEEAQKHLVNILVLAALLASEIRSLSEACIKENSEISEHYLEWKVAFEKLTTQKVTDQINSILESNVSLLDEINMRRLSEILEINLIEEGQFVPIKNDKLKEALLLK